MSMGWAAGLKLRQGIDGLTRVLAIELLVAGRALDLRAPLLPATGTGAALGALRTVVDGIGPDRIVGEEIEATVELVSSGAVLAAVQSAIGTLS